MTNLANQFTEISAINANKTAVFWGENEITFGQAYSVSNCLANRLKDQFELKSGDRVALWLKNCPEFVFSLFGILLAEGVVVSINSFLTPDEVGYIVEDCGAKLVISEASMAEGTARLVENNPGLHVLEVESFGQMDSDESIESTLSSQSPEDLALIIYTSGTTGKPKGAMLSHQNLMSNVDAIVEATDIVDEDRMAVLLPMFHSFTMTVGLLLPMTRGLSIVAIKSLNPPKNIIAEIIQHQATVMPAIPQLYRAFVNVTLPSDLPLRVCFSGAAPLPIEVLNAFNENVGIPLLEGYGLSETSPVACMNPLHGERKAGSVGLPIRGVEFQIRNDDGSILPVNEPGEICIKGHNVMMGYWNNTEATAAAIKDDWFLTGDIGHLDEDGYLYITDRKKDMLLVNGINVYPREVEEVIYQFEGVSEVAVVGVNDPRKGDLVVACIVPKEECEIAEAELKDFLKTKLAAYKLPRKLIIMEALPRNATGKILKTKLREVAADRVGR
ncbi:MAG: long-chain fatty acid--CoA ligase [Verrucomicrobiota bacterium]|nr:long-chain fatty acid--CoA ligase [Verrucomicrobiota bacterium]